VFVNLPGDPRPQFPTRPGFPLSTTIEGRLARRGLDGRTFYSDVDYAAMWGRAGVQHSAPIAEYFERSALGTLPDLSFVDPQMLSSKELIGVTNDQHPVSDIRTGEWSCPRSSPRSCARRSGSAARCSSSGTSGAGSSTTSHRRACPTGTRAPTSTTTSARWGSACPPWSCRPGRRRGKVVHTRFGHESILRMVEDRYRLRPLTTRDARANSIAAAFDFTRPPCREPPALPTPPSIISEPCPLPSTE
jgi:phospholipase C